MGIKDRRRSRRMDLDTHLIIKRIDNGIEDYIKIGTQNLSKTGCGFLSKENLELEIVYESHITIWTKEVIHVLLKIVRKEEKKDGFLYGAVFMGLSDADAFRIEVYDMMDRESHRQEDRAEEEAGSQQ